jgi:hypothetical protein
VKQLGKGHTPGDVAVQGGVPRDVAVKGRAPRDVLTQGFFGGDFVRVQWTVSECGQAARTGPCVVKEGRGRLCVGPGQMARPLMPVSYFGLGPDAGF